jgi:hypothetical protein
MPDAPSTQSSGMLRQAGVGDEHPVGGGHARHRVNSVHPVSVANPMTAATQVELRPRTATTLFAAAQPE